MALREVVKRHPEMTHREADSFARGALLWEVVLELRPPASKVNHDCRMS
jgi:hypothetical protein